MKNESFKNKKEFIEIKKINLSTSQNVVQQDEK